MCVCVCVCAFARGALLAAPLPPKSSQYHGSRLLEPLRAPLVCESPPRNVSLRAFPPANRPRESLSSAWGAAAEDC